jgi:hypothetical protein
MNNTENQKKSGIVRVVGICTLVLVVACLITFSKYVLPTSALRQEPRNSSNTSLVRPAPVFELHADGSPVTPLHVDTDSERAVLNCPMPYIWLAYPEDSRPQPVNPDLKVQLPPDTVSRLDRYWKHSLAFSFVELSSPQDSRGKVSRDMERLSQFEESRRFLLDSEIETQAGVRKISDNEADSLLRYLGSTAHELVKNSKAISAFARTQSRSN